ncbi:MAG: hypothetical protein Kow0058_15590 [Roseovarius sp.]
MFAGMRRIVIISALIGALAWAGAAAAQTACRVEYKAKRDKPLTLFYDTVVLPGPCSAAEGQLRQMLAARGLVLLKILSKRPS